MSAVSDQSVQQRAIEEGPEYRSVMIQPASSPNMRRQFSPLEKASNFPVTLDHSRNNSKCESKRPSSFGYRWEQKELPNLSIDYILVRTNVYVKESNAQIIADRICNELKSSSIFVDSKGCDKENSILAETEHGVKLIVSLFGHNDMVVVEVRRQAGCSFHFRDAAKAILRSSKGLRKQQRSMLAKKFCISPMLPKRSQGAYHECIRDDFRIAYNMLHSKKADAHLLALETMGKMTTISDASDVAAKLVLSNYDCTKQLLSLFDLYTKDRSNLESKSCYRSTQCRKILEILANSCEAIGNNELATILSTNDHDLKTRSFVSFLISSLNEASIRPHDAFQAARCLRCLLISKEVERLLVEMSAIDVVASAHSVGVNCHEKLEQESFKLMGQLLNAS